MHRVFQAELSQADLTYVDEYEGNSGAFAVEYSVEDAGDVEQVTSPEAVGVPRIPPRAHSDLSRDGVRDGRALFAPSISLNDIEGVLTASRLERPPAPRVPFGTAAVDELTGGVPRGGLTEICGASSSGRTGLMLSIMAECTRRGELCALVDASDCFDPQSAAAAGVELNRLLWVRTAAAVANAINASGELCHSDIAVVHSALQQKQAAGSFMPHAKVWYGRSPARSERGNADAQRGDNAGAAPREEYTARLMNNRESASRKGADQRTRGRRESARRVDQALRATDLLLQGGGFGLVILDLGDVAPELARRIPLTSWFRFRRAVENTPAVLLSIVRGSCAKTCASLVLQMRACRRTTASARQEQLYLQEAKTALAGRDENGVPTHARVLTGLHVTVEVVRNAEQQNVKKPPRAAQTGFETQTEWTAVGQPSSDRAIR